MAWVAEEKEGACHQCGVEKVVAAAAKDLFANDYGEGYGQRQLPQRYGDGNYHRDYQSCADEAFADLLVPYLGKQELDAKTDNIADYDNGQHTQESEPPLVPEAPVKAIVCGCLVSDVPHTEQQGGQQGYDYGDDGALQVDSIADVAAFVATANFAAGYGVGRKGKRLECLECRRQLLEAAAFTEVGL